MAYVAVWASFGTNGPVGELSRASNACSDHGDSGGPVMTGHTALGVESGGSGPCDMFYSEVTDAENLLGIRVVTNATGWIP